MVVILIGLALKMLKLRLISLKLFEKLMIELPVLENFYLTTEMLGYIAATLTTISFLPQAILTIRTRDTDGLSLSMYSTFTLGVFCWMVYGLYLGNNVIILANSITLFLASIILSFKIYNSFVKCKK